MILFVAKTIFDRCLELQEYTNEANWAQDGPVLLQPMSHFEFFIRSLLQLCSYLVQQLPASYKVLIKPDVFLSAFSIEDKDGTRVSVQPWATAPDGSAYDTNIEVSSESTLNQNRQGNRTSHVSNGQTNSTVLRHELALQWIALQEKRYKFLPVAELPDFQNMRDGIALGPHGIRQTKKSGAKMNAGMIQKFFMQI